MTLLIIVILYFWGTVICAGLFFYFRSKYQKEKFDLKKILIYSLIFIVIFIFLSCFTLIPDPGHKIVYSLLIMSFFVSGVFHAWLVYRNKLVPSQNKQLLELLLTGVIYFIGGMFFIGFTFLFTKYVTKPQYDGYHTAILPFIIPIMIRLSYNFWRNIPRLVPEAWYYNNLYDPPNLIHSQDTKWINCTFRIQVTDYSISIPLRYKVGDAFHIMIQESMQHGEPIIQKELDVDGNLVSPPWYFIHKSITDKTTRYLDPGLTFENNEIKEGDIIWVRQEP